MMIGDGNVTWEEEEGTNSTKTPYFSSRRLKFSVFCPFFCFLPRSVLDERNSSGGSFVAAEFECVRFPLQNAGFYPLVVGHAVRTTNAITLLEFFSLLFSLHLQTHQLCALRSKEHKVTFVPHESMASSSPTSVIAPRPPSSATRCVQAMVARALMEPSDPLRPSQQGVEHATHRAIPCLFDEVTTERRMGLRPRLQVRHRIRYDENNDEAGDSSDDDAAATPIAASPATTNTAAGAAAVDAANRAPQQPVALATSTSLQPSLSAGPSLLATESARWRAANNKASLSQMRRGKPGDTKYANGNGVPLRFQSKTTPSRYLGRVSQYGSCFASTRYILDVGCVGEPIATMVALADRLADDFTALAAGLRRLTERGEAAAAAAAAGEATSAAAAHRAAEDLFALLPRTLPHLVLSYWDFTSQPSAALQVAQTLTACHETLGNAISRGWNFVRRMMHEREVAKPKGATSEVSSLPPPLLSVLEEADHRRHRYSALDDDETSGRCAVSWELCHCMLAQNTMDQLPLVFPEYCEGTWRDAFHLRSLTVAHCRSPGSTCYIPRLERVIRSATWSLRELVLRGVQVNESLLLSVQEALHSSSASAPTSTAAVGEEAGGGLRSLTFANCVGWSTTDPKLQCAMVQSLRHAPSLVHLVLQGVPLPPQAGIPLLEILREQQRVAKKAAAAVSRTSDQRSSNSDPVMNTAAATEWKHPRRLGSVILESCHFVTPRFLAQVRDALSDV